jgi:hypothetical protein
MYRRQSLANSPRREYRFVGKQTFESGKLNVPTQIRQGDVLMVRIVQLPAHATIVGQNQIPGRIVVAHGELTGHNHALAVGDAELYRTPLHRYLRVIRPTILEHEEHASIAIDPGVYEVIMQYTYTPGEVLPVPVID